MQTQTAARLGDANVDGVKNTDAGMVFDANVESRVCARNGKRIEPNQWSIASHFFTFLFHRRRRAIFRRLLYRLMSYLRLTNF